MTASHQLAARIASLGSVMETALRFIDLAQEYAQRPELANFAFGNPQEKALPDYVAALQRATVPQDKDWFAYTLSNPVAQEAISASLRAWRGIDFAPEDILVTTGAFAGLFVSLWALAGPGDEVLFMAPPWFFYEAQITAVGAQPVRVRVEPETFDLDLNAIADAITPRTRAIIVNSPHNPTGRIYPPETLRALADLLAEASARQGRPVYLLSDEAYSRIVFDGARYPSPTEFYPYTLLVYTYGKTLLTPGQRIGYIALPPSMPERETLRGALMMAQVATGFTFANALLQHAVPELERLSIDVAQLQARRDRLVGALRELGYELHSPEGTFYLLPRSPLEDDWAFSQILLRHNILCLPGMVTEAPGYFRLSITASDDMIEQSLPGFERAMNEAIRERAG